MQDKQSRPTNPMHPAMKASRNGSSPTMANASDTGAARSGSSSSSGTTSPVQAARGSTTPTALPSTGAASSPAQAGNSSPGAGMPPNGPAGVNFDSRGWLHMSLKRRRKEYVTLKPIRMVLGTWNVGGAVPVTSYHAWIHGNNAPDPPTPYLLPKSQPNAQPASLAPPPPLPPRSNSVLTLEPLMSRPLPLPPMDFSDTPLSTAASPDNESSAPLLLTSTVQSNASVASSSSRTGLGGVGAGDAAGRSRQSSPTRSTSQALIDPSADSPTSLPKCSSVTVSPLAPRPLPPLPTSTSPTPSLTPAADSTSPTHPALAPGDIIALGLQEADTSTEVYLAHDPATLSTFRDQVTAALGPEYAILSARQLAGLVLIVAVHERIRHAIRSVEWSSVGCGVLGVLGNKGGVAVRFWVYDSRMCIVNAHLAADHAQLARRNSDFHEIRRRLWFRKEEGGVGTVDDPGYDEEETVVFWLGDLNYRLQGTQERVVQIINENRLDSLLVTDQLKQAMAKGDAFAGFQEPPISFPPTYKYDIGTTKWDTSEKRRTPAWCDRILWHLPATSPESVQPTRYMGHFGYLDSDHRPVSAALSVHLAVIDPAKLDDVTCDILREHDKWENELIPEASVLPAIVDLGPLRMLHECMGECTVENTGKIPFVWEFVARPDHVPASGGPAGLAPWCTPEPQRGVLEPGDRQRIVFLGYPTPAHATLLNRSDSATVTDIFILRLQGGRDFFVAVEGTWQRTVLTQSLAHLCRSPGPARSRPAEHSAHPPLSPAAQHGGLPKELVSISQYLHDHAARAVISADVADLVTGACDDAAVETVIEQLDVQGQLDADALVSKLGGSPEVADRAVIRALLMVLEFLPEPLVPMGTVQERLCVAASGIGGQETVGACMEILAELPDVHRSSLLFVIGLCHTLAQAYATAKAAAPAPDASATNLSLNHMLIAESKLSEVFGPVVMRFSSNSGTGAMTPSSSKDALATGGKKHKAKVMARQRAFLVLLQAMRGELSDT